MANQKDGGRKVSLRTERHWLVNGVVKRKERIWDAHARGGEVRYNRSRSRLYRLRKLELEIEDLDKQIKEVA
jgi:hypothetical protein|tara:strand:- start:250 stop:465 length:216 start_codon:yes stop_codon:yes gene_type:complete